MKHLGPHPTGIADPFWSAPAAVSAATSAQMNLPWCDDCRRASWPPRWVCRCGSRLGWRAVEGRGRLVSWSTIQRAVHPEMGDQVPYVVGFVQLDAGPVIFTNIVDIPPADLKPGLALVSQRDTVAVGEMTFEVPVFGPAPAAGPLTAETVRSWTLGRFIDEAGARFGDRTAFIASDRRSGESRRISRTYAELRQDALALQRGLEAIGIGRGQRVGVMLSSTPEWIVLLFALTRMGCAFVPISTRFRSRELRHVLAHAEATTLVAMGEYLGHDYRADIAAAIDGQPGDGSGRLPHLRQVIGVGSSPTADAHPLDALIERGRALLAQQGPGDREDDVQATAILFYTSGTTAFPKGVPLTHANLLGHSVGAGELIELRPGERVLSLYPFFGISGGANKVLSTLGAGACLVFLDAWRAAEASLLLDELGCVVIHGVDVQVRELVASRQQLGEPGFQPDRRGTIAFTAGVDPALVEPMASCLGLRRFVHPYGMTETNPMILRNALDDGPDDRLRPGGRIAPGVEVRVLDPLTGMTAAVDVPGEIVVRGATVTAGYLNDEAANRAAFADGWFRTGDQGVRDDRGFIFYLGRLKDMLKVGGFNVAPQEIESFLMTLPGIEAVAVTGKADARLGEVPVAFVVEAAPGCVIAVDVIAACRRSIANFKVPQAVTIVPALPYHTAANGSKLQRQVLRRWAETGVPDPLPQERDR